ncbi:hypothetical protein MMC29_008002 [Sticta canariensis]|nr:hypothetical protein [Sticta canariensis]
MASATDKDKFTGTTGTDEPDSTDQGTSGDASVTAKSNSRQSALSSPPRLPRRASTVPILSSASSATTSPKPSREVSPNRPPFKSGSGAVSRGSRSRKNSQDLSPNRAPPSNIPAVPSAAAIQRALSAAGTPLLQSPSSSEFSLDATRAQKPGKGSGTSHQLGSNLPRVKSPPPSASSNKASSYSARKPDQASSTPSIVLERPSPVSGSIAGIDEAEEGILVPSGMRTPVRGSSVSGPTLETVQESSDPATPAIGATKIHHGGKTGSDDAPETVVESPLDETFAKETKTKAESGSESGGNKSTGTAKERKEARRPEVVGSSVKPHIVHPKTSFTQLHPAKGKTGSEGTVKNMTVETETVSTIPQVALGGGAGERTGPGRAEPGGSLRLKPSNETIRPRKEKKKVVRKAPSLNSGTGGSSSRRFHHHHIYSRRPSPENIISLSTVPPLSTLSPSATPASAFDHDCAPSASQPSDRGHRHVRGRSLDSHASDANHRPSSATLTSFRGRTASSKADIFEAKVASAVEVNSSDSEETFVYESNPPEPLSTRPHRFHSRTPSATSMASQMDQYGTKGRQDGHHSIAGKKSMKFANNSYHTPGFSADSNDGTVRGPGQSGRPPVGNVSHHHHIGRYGRGGHTSLFDTESPFPTPGRPLRNPHAVRVPGHSRKPSEPMSYDLEGEGADDERTPLIGSVQSRRNRNTRRPIPGTLRSGCSKEEKGHRLCRCVTAFASLGILLALLIAAIVVILIMCSKPLYDVHIKDIRNVLASEQALIFDINVHAVNPNLISVQVSDLNLSIFAKSKHVGGKRFWRRRQNGFEADSKARFRKTREGASYGGSHQHQGSEGGYQSQEGVDEGTDPIDDPETDSQTMLLGRISEFDSPLIFDPSPIRRNSLSSIGEVLLSKPGNTTEDNGSERWEKVIQSDFELIVRGVLRYSLPIFSRPRSASVFGSVIVHPGEEDETLRLTEASTSHHSHPSGDNVLV